MTLYEFLHLPHVFEWGGSGRLNSENRLPNDCTTFCSSWVECVSGIDLASAMRGVYRTDARAQEILDDLGGLVALYDERLGEIGVGRTENPQDGDIGVIRAPAGIGGEVKEIGAIRFGPLWATLGPAGVRAKKIEHVAAWRLSC